MVIPCEKCGEAIFHTCGAPKLGPELTRLRADNKLLTEALRELQECGMFCSHCDGIITEALRTTEPDETREGAEL